MINLLQIPRPVTETLSLKNTAWKISLYQEYLAHLKSGPSGIFDPKIIAELEEHLWPNAPANYRLQIHLKAAPFLVGFLVDRQEIVIASPRLAWELFLLQETPDSCLMTHDLRKHIEKILSIDLKQSPTVIEQITERYQLPNFFADEALQQLCEKSKELEKQLWEQLENYHSTWFEKISDLFLKLTARSALFRIHLLKFVAILPCLDHDKKGAEIKRIYLETLRRVVHDSKLARAKEKKGQQGPLPRTLIFLLSLERFIAKRTPAYLLANNIRFWVRLMAKRFIAGESIEKATQVFQSLQKTRRDVTLDQLGELVVSEKEAGHYCGQVIQLIRGLSFHIPKGEKNSAGIQRAHVSVKVSALASDFKPQAPEYTFQRVAPRLKKILLEAKAHDVFINIDAEHYPCRDLVFSIYKRVLLETPQLHDYQATGVVIQAYLRDAAKHFEEILALAKGRGLMMPIRLVKGAYWDQETVHATAGGYDPPEFLNKEETDIHCRQLILKILEAAPHLQLCLGSHNLTDHCFAETAWYERFGYGPNSELCSREGEAPTALPLEGATQAPKIEHQCLHKTYEALSQSMAKMGWPHHLSIDPAGQSPSAMGKVVGWAVRNYVPIGSLLVGMAYLVRRIMENSSQVGILVQMRKDKETEVELPQAIHHEKKLTGQIVWDPSITELTPDFFNTPPLRFEMQNEKEALTQVFEAFSQTELGKDYSKGHYSGDLHKVFSPSDPETCVGQIQHATGEDTRKAIQRAKEVYNKGFWAKAKPIERASVLMKAAQLMLLQRLEFVALMVHEGGKNFFESMSDVNEAIDFLNFYAREECRLVKESPRFVSRGVFGVISPWNFPLAIPTGMAAGALAAGNAVILKPAEHTPLITQRLADILHEAGVPPDILVHLPGKGSEVGKLLVEHPAAAGIVFTGSKQVGMWIAQTVGKKIVRNELFRFEAPAKVITEMGGKNAVIVTANAELDETVVGILYSAFGNAGQKCSAASRVLVDERIKNRLMERLKEACLDLKVGPAFDHASYMNPLIARREKERLQKEIEEACRETKLYGGQIVVNRSKEPLPGCCLGPALIELPLARAFAQDSFSQRELFGPCLHIFSYKNFDEAVQLFNTTEYGLTGGIFSQSQDDIEILSKNLEAGNIYVNRSITGARVAIEPFGGMKLSGTGPKVGSPFYLEAFHYFLEEPEKMAEPVPLEPEILQKYKKIVRTAYPTFKEKFHWNRKIPGQLNFNDLNLIKKKGLYIGLEEKPNIKTFLYFLSAITVGAKVKVLSKHEGAHFIWKKIAEILKEKIDVVMADTEQIQKAIQDEESHFLIVEGAPAEVKYILNLAYNGHPEKTHLWSILTKLDAPPVEDIEKFLEKFVEVRSFAVNVMRHGAPLEI